MDELTQYRFRGLVAAGCVIAAWATALAVSVFVLDWRSLGLAPAILIAATQTWLFTGLFITAHDAMHGLVAPRRYRLNKWVGRAAAFLYAGLSYDRLVVQHRKHHAAPATPDDPDWHRGRSENVVSWFLSFVWSYRTIRPFVFFWVIDAIVVKRIGVPVENLLLGWALPAIASAIQLFFFGTYLPHRRPKDGYSDQRATSNPYPVWLSLLTCFHFGYHYEHHKWPFVPWWRLPEARRRNLRC